MEDNENPLQEDKSLNVLRIEKNKHNTIFLYYKQYPKKDSSKFPTEQTAIFFYFDTENVNEKFLNEYLNIAGDIQSISFGKYLNKKGCKKKRRVVQFAIVTFKEESTLQTILNRNDFQIQINNYIEQKRGLRLEYDPTKIFEAQNQESLVDEDGFVKVTPNCIFALK